MNIAGLINCPFITSSSTYKDTLCCVCNDVSKQTIIVSKPFVNVQWRINSIQTWEYFFLGLLGNCHASVIVLSSETIACTTSLFVCSTNLASFSCILMCHSPLGFNGLNLRTTSCLNWRRWWMTSEPRHLNREVLQIPTWSQFHLKIWRREFWRLWRGIMGRC